VLVAPNWDLSSLEDGRGLFDWEGEGGMGEPVKVFGRGGGGGDTTDDTPFNKEVAEVAKLHNDEEAADGEDEDDDDEGEVLGGIDPSLRVVNGSTGL
jgi:hypothetical protein